MLMTILSAIGGKFIDGFFSSALQAFTAYQNKQISEAQLKEQLLQAMLQAARDVEVSANEALAKTYASFMDAAKQNTRMSLAWACAVYSQLTVLTWHQLGIPAVVILVRWVSEDSKWNYPSSGSTVEWAYLLLGGLLGMAPMVLRSGPGAGNIVERFKAAIK